MSASRRLPGPRRLFSSIVRNLPHAFATAALEQLPLDYRHATALVDDNPRVDPMYHSYLRGQEWHYHLQSSFLRLAERSGMDITVQRTVSAYPYPVCRTGPFVLTASAVHAPTDVPELVEFRKGLAASNAILENPAFEFIAPKSFHSKGRRVYAVLTHAPGLASMGIPDHVSIGIPTQDMGAWLVRFALKDIVAAQQKRRKQADEPQLVDLVTPRLRRATGSFD